MFTLSQLHHTEDTLLYEAFSFSYILYKITIQLKPKRRERRGLINKLVHEDTRGFEVCDLIHTCG